MKIFSPDSKVWLYPINESISPEQKLILEQKLGEFMRQWKAHGVPVVGAFEVIDSKFVLITADSNSASASGCSVDSMMKAVTEALKLSGSKMSDFSNVFYVQDGSIKEASRSEFARLKSEGKILEDTKVYDLTSENLGVFLTRGICLPYKESWHAKVFG